MSGSHPELTSDPQRFVAALAGLKRTGAPTMPAAMLVDPSGFGLCQQSARDNHYMDLDAQIDLERAHAQHQVLARTLRSAGLSTLVLPGRRGHEDGVFLNNVYATIPGRFVIGRMLHPARQVEATRRDVRRMATDTLGRTLIDLSASEHPGELTGVLAIDRARGAAICGMSQRVDEQGAAEMAEALDLKLVLTTPLRSDEYHLNIVLAVLAGRAVIMADAAFADPGLPAAMEEAWPDCVLHLSPEEKAAFAGNCIAITPTRLLMSQTAADSLRASSREWLSARGFVVIGVAVDEFEKAGGSLRCLVAEIF